MMEEMESLNLSSVTGTELANYILGKHPLI